MYKRFLKNKKLKTFPVAQLVLAIFLDVAEFSFPVGYFVSLAGDSYLYLWAVDYLELDKESVKSLKNKTLSKVKSNLLLRIILEAVPFINFLPISTYFVYTVWREKEKRVL